MTLFFASSRIARCDVEWARQAVFRKRLANMRRLSAKLSSRYLAESQWKNRLETKSSPLTEENICRTWSGFPQMSCRHNIPHPRHLFPGPCNALKPWQWLLGVVDSVTSFPASAAVGWSSSDKTSPPNTLHKLRRLPPRSRALSSALSYLPGPSSPKYRSADIVGVSFEWET